MVELIEYQQLDDPGDSDHLPVEFYIGVNVDKYEKKKKKTNWILNKKTKWDLYRKELNIHKEELGKDEYLRLNEEEKYQRICEMMKEAVVKATYGEKWKEKILINGKIRKKNSTHKNKNYVTNPAQWWDKECEQVLKNKKQSFKEWKKKQNYGKLYRIPKDEGEEND